MKKKKIFSRSLCGMTAAFISLSTIQAGVLYTSAAEVIEQITAEIGSGDVNGDGKTDSADITALAELISSSADTVSSSSKKRAYDVYRDDVVDVKDLIAVRQIADGNEPAPPSEADSGKTVKFELTNAECCPGEQVKVDIKIVDWNQDIEAIEVNLDYDSSLTLVDVSCTGAYQSVTEDNKLKIFGFCEMADVYRGTVATLTFDVPDTAYGDYDYKINNAVVYNKDFQTFSVSSEVGLIAADVTERPLYLSASYVNSESMRLSWSMPYCSGELEGFIIYRDDEEIARTSDLSYYDKNLETVRKYVYSVQAYGADNYSSAKSKSITASPQKPVVSAVTFPDNASEIGGKSTYVKCALEKTVDASEYSLSYTDLQGEQHTIFKGADSAFSAVEIKWNIGELPSGEYELLFSVTDKDGASAEKTVTVNVDTTPAKEVYGFEVFEGEQQMQLTWGIASEAKVTGYNVYRRTDDSAYTLLEYVDGRETLEYTDENLQEGDVYFYMICAVDKYGQEGIYSAEKSAAVQGDKTSPEVTLFLPEQGNTLSHTVTISLKADDNIGVASITAYISEDDGETWEELFTGKGSAVNYRLDTSEYSDKIKIKAVAFDYAGNQSKDLVHLYAVDHTPPAIVEGIEAVAVTDVTATISWNDVPDNDFKYFAVKYYPTDNEDDVKTQNVYSTLGVNLLGLSPDTEYSISVASVDIYGNQSEYSEPFTFTTISDTTAPVVTGISPAPAYFSKEIPLYISAQDDFSVASVTIQTSADNGESAEWTDLAVVANESAGTYFGASYKMNLADYSDGTIYVRAFATDTAGNIGEPSAVYEYIVDKTAPKAPTTLESSSDANEIQLKWQAFDNKADSVAFSLYRSTSKDGEYTCILSNASVLNHYDRTAEPETQYYYKLTAIDAAGNESPMSKAVSAKLEKDTEAPEIVSVYPDETGILSTASRKISVLASDNVKLDSVKMEYRTSSTAEYKVFSEKTDIEDYYTVAEANIPLTALESDKVQIRITAVDSSGNVSEAKEVELTVDNSKVNITSVKAQQLEEYISVDWSAEENETSQGYYIYKKVNTGSWKKIGAVEAEKNETNKYSFKDYDTTANGTISYKIESYSSTGIKTYKESQQVQVYTAPEVSLECETTQQEGVEYIFDATGCNDYYGITSVKIDFGDGMSATEKSASNAKFVHKYKETGRYDVTLTCENEQGLTTTEVQTIEVLERTLIGESVITVKTTEGKPASDIYVYVDLGTEMQKKIKTDNSGTAKITASAGIHTIGVYGDGYLPTEKNCTILAGKENKMSFTVVEEDIVTADFEVERMTLDEIKAVGINVSDPQNQHIVAVDLNVTYKGTASASSLRCYVNNLGKVVATNGGGGWSSGGLGGSWGGGSGSGSVTKPVYISVDPDTNTVNTVVTITVPVGASFLKEFFHAKLTVYNNADEEYTISDNEVSLNLPEGLALVKTDKSYDKDVSFDVIKGQSSKEIDWIIRGDKEGTYNLSASYHGILDRFNEEINEVFETDEPITVYGESAVSVDVNIPDRLYENRFVYEVAMTNNSPIDIYCPSTNVGEAVSNAFEKEHPVIYQKRLMKDGKYVKILPNDEDFETLEPGYTYSVIYKTPSFYEEESAYRYRYELLNASVTRVNESNIPVALNVLSSEEFVLMDQLAEIPDYDPDTEFVLFVADQSGRQVMNGAKITYGGKTYTTEKGAYAVIPISETASSLEVSKSGFDTKTIKTYTGYMQGVDMIVLSPEKPPYVAPPTVTTRPGTSGGIASGGTNVETGIETWNGNLELGGELDLGTDASIPFIGGSTFEISGFNSPVHIETDDNGHVILYLGEKTLYGEDDEDDLWKDYQDAVSLINDFANSGNKSGFISKFPIQDYNEPWSVSVKIAGVMYGTYPGTKGFSESVKENGVEFGGKIIVVVEGGTTIRSQLAVGVIPVACELEIKDEAKATADFKLQFKDNEFIPSATLTFENEFSLTPSVGVGFAGVAAAGIYGQMSLALAATLLTTKKDSNGNPDTGVDSVSASFEIGVQAYLGPFKVSKSLVGSELQIYDKEKGFVWDWQPKEAPGRFKYAILDESLYSLQTATGNVWKGSTDSVSYDENGYAVLNSIVEDSSGVTSQQIQAVGDKLVMVYLENDSTREAINGLRLMYSVYDKKAGTWSKPAQVDTNGTGDYAPQLYSDGEKLYLVYQDTASVLDKDAELTDWTTAQNIAVSAFNTDTLKFEKPELLTTDSDVYDSKPSVVIVGGRVYAVWNSNENSDYFCTNDTNRIMASELTDNGWSEPQILADNLNAVTNIETGAVNDSLCVVYITDNDNDITTTDDRTLNAINTYDGQIYELTYGNIDSAKFAQAVDDDKEALYWYEDGNLVKTNNLTFKSRVFSEAPETLSSNFEILGNRILWSGSVDGNSAEIYESVYDSADNAWSSAVALTNQGSYIENMSAVNIDGTIYAVMNRNDITITTKAVESENSIVFTAFSGLENLTVASASYNEYKYSDGVLPVYVALQNNGENKINSVKLTVLDSENNVVCETTSEEVINAGESNTVTVDVPIDTAKSLDFTVKAETEDIKDSNPDDNTTSFNAGFSNIFVEASKKDDNTLVVTVTNNGTASAPAEISIMNHMSDDVLKTVKTDSIGAGESVSEEINLSAYVGTATDDLKVSVSVGDTSQMVTVYEAMQDVTAYKLGDVNEDGKIDATDASLVLYEYSLSSTGKESVLTDSQKKSADVNSDGLIDADDASKILKYYTSVSIGNADSDLLNEVAQ
ncbi:MAG: fibronectin type III domain-containing protein [Ruminococcus flavefaciens]|nr:fibronectin type III domain-containing protein [Ruminococcus flavefaciens]MCM1230416.1 fibronectin type III domain-containing protein [Ruminococcus flavefaciens]